MDISPTPLTLLLYLKIMATPSSQYNFREHDRDRHKSATNPLVDPPATPLQRTVLQLVREEEIRKDTPVNVTGTTDIDTTPKISTQTGTVKDPKQQEVPVINMKDFQNVDMESKLDLLMAAINKINTNFHYKFEDLKKNLTDKEDGVFPRLREVEATCDDLVSRIDDLESKNAALSDEVEILKGLLQVQDQKVARHESKIIDLTARSMSNNILISGITNDVKDEDCVTKVKTLFKDIMKMPVDDDEIEVAHRLGAEKVRITNQGW